MEDLPLSSKAIVGHRLRSSGKTAQSSIKNIMLLIKIGCFRVLVITDDVGGWLFALHYRDYDIAMWEEARSQLKGRGLEGICGGKQIMSYKYKVVNMRQT